MELEAENWWLDSTSHDFDDKKVSSKNINFFLSKIFSSKTVQLFQQQKIQNEAISYQKSKSAKILKKVANPQF